MGPIIDIIRHTEAWHNVSRDSYIRDPGLTPNGEAQSYQLRDEYPFMSKVSHVVCSPLRRAVATALIAFDPVVSNGKKAILLPDLQETGSLPSDTGSPAKRLDALFRPHADLSHLGGERWYRRDADSDYAPDVAKVEMRARRARRFLRRLARDAADGAGGEDAHIAVVTHGGFLHFLAEDYAGLGPGRFASFRNAEMRSYRFADLRGGAGGGGGDEGDNATLVRVRWSGDLRPMPLRGEDGGEEEEEEEEEEEGGGGGEDRRKRFAVDRVRLQGLNERKMQLRQRKEDAVSPRAREVASIVEASFLAGYAEFLETWSHRAVD